MANNKELKYNGISAVPSDYDSPDGDLTVAINLINDDGELKKVPLPKRILSLQKGETALLVHNVPGQKNYILARAGSDESFDICWMKKDSAIYNTDKAKPIVNFEKLLDITAVGNTLVFALEEGLQYMIWKDDDYQLLGNRPPFLSIDFGMYKVGTLSEHEEYSISARCAPSWSGTRESAEKEELIEMTQFAYGLLNPAIADKITTQGYFYQPFFVRYAYRLYDGTLNWHSAPILMLPTILPPFIKYTDDGSHPAAGGTLKATLTLDVPYFGLSYRILPDGVEELADWSDLIVGIEIFVSAPIYTYDQSKDLPWRPVVLSRRLLSGISPDKETSIDGGRPTQVPPDEVFVGHYADGLSAPYIDRTMSTLNDSELILNIGQRETFYDNIRNAHDFYKIARIGVKDIKATSLMQHLELTDKDLSSLVTKEPMSDEYQSHCKIIAKSLYAFNSRLNLADVEITPPTPFPIRSGMQFGNPEGPVTTPRITVWTRINGVRCHACRSGIDTCESDIWHDPERNFPRFIYYPDASAYKMEIFISDSQKYTINLEPHDFLNGAIYFMGKSGMSKDPIPVCADPETADSPMSVSVSSKIYTSEINNPFSFPLAGINTVGSGEVLSISSAAKALSQGQFGQFPLYAFTSEGVWALETTSTGTYSARQPITRDVCISSAAITQIDSSVLFATDRGIMLISGSQTQCISDAINNDSPIDLLTALPGLEKLNPDHNTCLRIAPFREFLKTSAMIYDYVHQHIIVYSTHHAYAYIYSLQSRQWGMMLSNLERNVNSYPEALAINGKGELVDFSTDSAEECSGLLVTRPLKLGAPDIHKTIDNVIQRGNFRKGHVRSVLYGSRDLVNWHLVWSSKDHFLRGFRGTPYKYFRIALLSSLDPGESIYGASVQFTPRLTNQPR